jgi:exodeoxyribonuclease VII small subunit
MAESRKKGSAKSSRSRGKKEPTFEEALQRLENLVERLEEGDIPLEESLEAYAEGTRLIQLCMERLARAESMIRELHETTQGFRLEASAVEADPQDEDGDPQDGNEDPEGGPGQDELRF